MGQRKKIDRFNDDLDDVDGPTREEEDAASRVRIERYRGELEYGSTARQAAMRLAIEAENDWRESIELERI